MDEKNYGTERQLSLDDLFDAPEAFGTGQSENNKQQSFTFGSNKKTFPIELVRDFDKFMSYIQSHPIQITKKRGYLSSKHLPFINQQLSVQAKDTTNYSQQEYYPYIHFFYQLATSAHLIKKELTRNHLTLTDRWSLYQKLSEAEKYCFLLETFWVDLDWSILSDHVYSSIDFVFPEMLEKISVECNEDMLEIANDSLLFNLLEKWSNFILYFEWFGLWVCKKDYQRVELYGKKLVFFAEKIKLTTFAVKVLSILLEQRDLYKWNIPLRRRMFGEINPIPGAPLHNEEAVEKEQSLFNVALIKLFPSGGVKTTLPRMERKFVSGRHTFKVSLNQSTWRTVVLSGDNTMDDLHHIIIKAYQFDDDHLYSFFMDGQKWSEDSIVSPLDYSSQSIATEVMIGSVGMHVGQQFMYLYDYGDEWTFNVTVMGIEEGETKPIKPYISAEKGKAPEQYYYYDD
ncbi:plasmid pRiA4b ORF-3 family protein [Amphibacillus indicireducens]|uniref:Plasmid pRiA4b Orf3-like domain-containing protein n=1 Tax=Amphibacillus indicireducens TaxID=1076330 RepID=A0ABP7V3X2_9BACI